MLKTISIGDVHGRQNWLKVGDLQDMHDTLRLSFYPKEKPKYDKYIFVGDYTDSFDVDDAMIIHNLKDLIALKIGYPDHIVLLLGNHDLQYFYPSPGIHQCSGYRAHMQYDLYELFRKNAKYFQMSYQYQNYIWTHAGIHKGWYNLYFKDWNSKIIDTTSLDISGSLKK